MENKDLNKRVLERLEQKIAIEEFKKENKIEEKNNIKTESKKKKSYAFLKVASFIVVSTLIAGNAYTYATFNTDIFSYALDKIGIFNNKEQVTELNEIKDDEKATLTLENYAMDKNTLLVGYRLKFKEKPEYFFESLIDEADIVDGERTYRVLDTEIANFTKINDFEYEVVKIYKLDTAGFSDNAIFKTKVTLYKELEGPIEEIYGNWEFEFKLDKSKAGTVYEKYTVENKKITLENLIEPGARYANPNDKNQVEYYNNLIAQEDSGYVVLVPDIELQAIHQSEIATKFVINTSGMYSTTTTYWVEIEDENGNKILQDNLQRLIGGTTVEIVIGKIELNQKIKINIYERDVFGGFDKDKILAKGTIEVDLSKDLKELKEQLANYKTETWEGMKFKIEEDTEVSRDFSPGYQDFEKPRTSISFKFRPNDLQLNYKEIYIVKFENLFNKPLKQAADDYKYIEALYYGNFQEKYIAYPLKDSNDKFGEAEAVEVTFDELIQFGKTGEVTLSNGKVLNNNNLQREEYSFSEMEEIKLDGMSAVKWTSYSSSGITDFYAFLKNGELYVIKVPSELVLKDLFDNFINDIEIID